MSWPRRINRAIGNLTGFELRRRPPQPVTPPAKATAGTAAPAPAKRARRKPQRAPIPAATMPAGTAKSSMFFDGYERFGRRQMHMNLRYEAIIAQNRDVFAGARVLDLACSEGAWSIAALDAGAAHVIGIESRPDKVENANQHFQHYGIADDRYTFIAGDVFEVLEREKLHVDLVLCLGYLYHTLRYPELMHHIHATGANALIIDTEVAATAEPYVRLIAENVDSVGNASQDEFSAHDSALTGSPSLAAIEKMLGVYGFGVERRSDWASILRDNADTGVKFPVYANGRRLTVLCRRGDDLSWQEGESRR